MPAATASHTTHFRITGEFITKHARDRMWERGWEDALRFMIASLPEMGMQLICDLLAGKIRLVGTNSVTVQPEKSTTRAKVIERSNYFYAGTVFDGKHYWKPYAYVNNLGERDVNEALTGKYTNPYVGVLQLVNLPGNPSNVKPRYVHYMDNKRRDRPIYMDVNGEAVCVLWKWVRPPPVWVTLYNTMQWKEALEAYLKVGKKHMDVRGHSQWYPYVKRDNAAPIWARAAAEQTKPYEYPPMPDEDKELAGECGWILPDGRFFACRYAAHRMLAETLIYRVLGREPGGNPENEADHLGWVKVAYVMLDDKKNFMLLHDKKGPLTPKQMEAVSFWCDKHKEPLPYWWEDKAKDQT